MWVRAAITIALLLLPTALHAQAEKRIALLIGNKDYKAGVGALTNPLNDIRIVGEALKAVGFEVLKPVENAQRSAMLITIHAFAAKLKAAGPDAVGFLYYSGHGIASAGENYLIPTDVDEPSTVLLSVQGVKQSEVLGILRGEAPNAAHFLVLDACRHTLRGARGGKGFVPVGQQSGVLVAFAAEPGKTASDIGQGSGPYAAALATELVKPGQSDLIMFHHVRVAVMDKTKGDQVPWTEDGIQRRQRVSFGGEAKAPPSSRQRIEELKKQAASSPALSARKNEAPTVSGMLRCESYPERSACELNTNCSWADNRKQCEQKSGSLATATLEALPPSKPALAPAAPCVEALVGSENRCLKPGESYKDCPECPVMVAVPAGEFMMGSPNDEEGRDGAEGPQHKVTIGNPFAVGKFELTFAEWEACVAGGGCTGNKSPKDAMSYGKGRRPVLNVSWDDAKEYVGWLSRKTGKMYRLLSEAEWEYAARAGTTTPFSIGNSISTDQANFNGSYTYGGRPRGEQRDRTLEVGAFQPNAFGLYDMHGNIAEWVEDCWHGSYQGAPTDGSAWTTSCTERDDRVLRGGSFRIGPAELRSACRWKKYSWAQFYQYGFRVARTL